jgi:hypothetical protein
MAHRWSPTRQDDDLMAVLREGLGERLSEKA